MTRGRSNDPMDKRATLSKIRTLAQDTGYTVTSYGPYDFEPDEMTLDLDGHGELFEAHFRRSPTGYWRFWYGFRHGGMSGDRIPTLRKFTEEVSAWLRA
jgi:hypothetical protein